MGTGNNDHGLVPDIPSAEELIEWNGNPEETTRRG
jgi:hypothetical protein